MLHHKDFFPVILEEDEEDEADMMEEEENVCDKNTQENEEESKEESKEEEEDENNNNDARAKIGVPVDVCENEAVKLIRWALRNKHVVKNNTLVIMHVEKPIRYTYLRTPGGQEMAKKQQDEFDRVVCNIIKSLASDLVGLGLQFERALVRGNDKGKTLVESCTRQAVDKILMTERKHTAGIAGKTSSVVEKDARCPVHIFRESCVHDIG